LLAGTFEPFDEERANQVGATGWISKPFTSQALVDKVEETLAEVNKQEKQWQRTPSQSPADSMLNAFEQVAATEFGSGRSDEVSANDIASGSFATPPTPEPEQVSPAEPPGTPVTPDEGTSAFASGGREDFSFDDLAASDETQESHEPSAVQEEQPAAESSEALEQTPEPDAFEVSEAPSVPGADFSFTSEQSEEAPEVAPAGDLSDPFAVAEDENQAVSGADEPELPDLDEFTPPVSAPEPESAVTFEESQGHTSTPEVIPDSQEIAPDQDSDVIDLQEDQIVAEGKYAATKPRVEARAAYLSDEELERIIERVAGSVIERLAAPIMERVVWEVVPDLAESMIREEMEKIKQQTNTGQ
jgi:hypothetical protein